MSVLLELLVLPSILSGMVRITTTIKVQPGFGSIRLRSRSRSFPSFHTDKDALDQ
jgi:hypothetical protein